MVRAIDGIAARRCHLYFVTFPFSRPPANATLAGRYTCHRGAAGCIDHYIRSRAWARPIYGKSKWSGLRWWSYYDPAWSSYGLWDTDGLTLALEHPALVEASRTIVRRVVLKPR